MSIRVVRLGSPRSRGEGIRLGTVRRPPRGVPRSEYASRDFYDVWLPNLAPSQELVNEARTTDTESGWKAFARKYRAEMKTPETAHILDALAALSHSADFAVGCYCENESHCHRSLLRELLIEHGAKIAD